MASNPTLMHFYYLAYFSDLRFLLIWIIIRLAFETSIAFRKAHAGVERLTLRRTVDSQDWVPYHLLAPETSDGNRLEGPVLRLPTY
jgi:hypothetical protein